MRWQRYGSSKRGKGQKQHGGSLTHVLANVLNLNSRSRASPFGVRVQRPPLAVRSGARAASAAVGSAPAEKLGRGVVLILAILTGAVVVMWRVSMVAGWCGCGCERGAARGGARVATRERGWAITRLGPKRTSDGARTLVISEGAIAAAAGWVVM